MWFNLTNPPEKHLYLRKPPLYYDKVFIFTLLDEGKQMKKGTPVWQCVHSAKRRIASVNNV
jgi:hypothetical protein